MRLFVLVTIGTWLCVLTNEGRSARIAITEANALPLRTATYVTISYAIWD